MTRAVQTLYQLRKLEQLTIYINRVLADARLKRVHLSLSLALCNSWIESEFQSPYRVSRSGLMKASRIRSKATYHKALKDLQSFGYLKYFPSYHPIKASQVMITELLKENANEHN